MILVADTGPLIALANIEKLDLLKNLTWQTVCIPPRVHKELWAKVGPESDAIAAAYPSFSEFEWFCPSGNLDNFYSVYQNTVER
jgi:hypothetical protein